MQTKLLAYRKINRKSQKELADLIGVSVKTYSDKELGKIQFKCDEMFTIANYFEASVEDIFLPRVLQNGVKEHQDE